VGVGGGGRSAMVNGVGVSLDLVRLAFFSPFLFFNVFFVSGFYVCSPPFFFFFFFFLFLSFFLSFFPPCSKDSAKRTPLNMAVERGLEPITRLLLQAGADPAVPDLHSKWTVAHVAASLGFIGILDALITRKVDMNAVDDQGDSVLHAAIRSGHVAVVKKLLNESNVNVEAVNLQGHTPLHTLARYPKDSAVPILRELFPHLKGSVNPQDEEVSFSCDKKMEV
jgi:hypothetical protein